MDTAQYSNIDHGYGRATQTRSAYTPKPDRTRLNIWLVLSTMVGLLLCLVAAICVIRVADGEEIHSWDIGPTVVLAVLSTVISTLLGLLLTMSVTIRWWREVQRGVDVSQLHYMWAVNRNLLFQPQRWKGNLFATASMTKLVLGTVFITISSFTIPPLLQQAVRPQRWTEATDTAVVTVNILTQLPSGLAGNVNLETTEASLDFKAAMAEWYNQDPILLPSGLAHPCPGSNSTCNGIIEGPGITVNCSTTRETPDLSVMRDVVFDIFRVNMTIAKDTNDEAFLDFAVDFVESIDSSCIASLVHERCRIYSALTNYSIGISNGVLEIDKREVAAWNSTIHTSNAGDLPGATEDAAAGPLRPLLAMHETYFQSYAQVSKNSRGTISFGILSQTLKVWGNNSDALPICVNHWRDPTSYILNGIGESLFRLALNGNRQTGTQTVPPSTPSPVDIPVTVTEGRFVFAPDYRFFAGALVLIVFCLLTGTILIWGWWELDRDVSLSPMETAQVFRDMDRTGDLRVEDLIKVYGNKIIKYPSKEAIPLNVPLWDGGGYEDGRVGQFASAGEVNASSSQDVDYDAADYDSYEVPSPSNMRYSGVSAISAAEVVEALHVDYRGGEEGRPHGTPEIP